MVELALALKAVELIAAAYSQVQAVLAARAAGKLSEEAASAELDKIIAAAQVYHWEPVAPAEG